MSIFFRSTRIGKHGVPFQIVKFRTLKEGAKSGYAHENEYVWGGRLMRKLRIDEIPQLWCLLRGHMALVGPRPQDDTTINLYPEHIREKLLSVKPGMFGLAGIYFIDEEHILSLSDDPRRDYWEKIAPLKIALDFFYIDNRCFSLNCWVVYQGFKKAFLSIWK